MNDAELPTQVHLAAQGDRDALQRLLVHYHPALRPIVARGIDGTLGRRLDADDVLQKAYIAAFEALQEGAVSHQPSAFSSEPGGGDPAIPSRDRQGAEKPLTDVRGSESNAGTARRLQFDGPAAFYAWLEQIALNELKNQQRDAGRQKRDVRREVHAVADTRASYPDLLHRLAGAESTPSRRLGRDEAVAAMLSSLARLTAEQRAVVQLRFLEGRSVPEVAARLDKREDAIHALCYRAMKELRAALGSITDYLTHL